ncbi:MAG: NAD-dependent epimerase/dehydratase family protein [Planctomycetota bacterium]
MNALVTGGTGFVGSHLIELLIAAGHSVRALVRKGSNADFVRSLGAGVATGDLDDDASLVAACKGIDVLYHSAARVEIVGTEDEFHRTTVLGTQRLVDAANAAGVKRFVYVSSCGIYHPKLLASGVIIDESTPTPEPPRWFIYGLAKYRAEKVVMEECRCEWTIVRLGYLYGPRNRTMHTYLAPTMRDDIMMILGNGENEMAMVYVVDAARAIVLAGTVPGAARRLLIAGPNERVTQRQYFDALADGFGIPRVKKKVPYAIAFFFGWLGEWLIKSGPRSHVLRRSAIALTGLPQRLRCDETQKILGWKPDTRFAEGMAKAFEWYKKEYRADHAAD